MKKLVLASTNKHKVEEFKEMLGGQYEIVTMTEIGFNKEIEETGTTSIENSKIKAKAVKDFCKEQGLDYAVIADDSGLFINSLNGEPGVHSARYASDHDSEANRQKVLKNMEGKIDRTAYFECAITYMSEKIVRVFVGRTFGEITTEKIGDESFTYDCIFYSNELEKTFGEATEEEKNSVSHRGRAVQQLVKWLTPSDPNFSRTVNFNK